MNNRNNTSILYGQPPEEYTLRYNLSKHFENQSERRITNNNSLTK